MNDSLSNVCRICYSNENKTTLANWCKCSGTIGLIHKSCLHRWLSQSNRKKCEICKYDFRFEIENPTFKQVIDIQSLYNTFYILIVLLLMYFYSGYFDPMRLKFGIVTHAYSFNWICFYGLFLQQRIFVHCVCVSVSYILRKFYIICLIRIVGH